MSSQGAVPVEVVQAARAGTLLLPGVFAAAWRQAMERERVGADPGLSVQASSGAGVSPAEAEVTEDAEDAGRAAASVGEDLDDRRQVEAAAAVR